MKIGLTLVTVIIALTCEAQQIEICSQGTKTSLRGLSIYNKSIWVSGSNGIIGNSMDGGITWHWRSVPRFEKTEFRDVEALSDNDIVVMGIASPAYILRSPDGGRNWSVVYENRDTSMFLDAMSFWEKRGMVVGDPIGQKIFTAFTKNSGKKWKQIGRMKLPVAQNGEAFFAASGTNILVKRRKYFIVSGGNVSRFFTNKKSFVLPIMRGKTTTGANGLSINKKHIAVAGGDFNDPNRKDSVFIYSDDLGKTWKLPAVSPSGYRSCVCHVTADVLVTCGINGVDISKDGGKTFARLSNEGFNTCAYSPVLKSVILAGNNGKTGRIQF